MIDEDIRDEAGSTADDFLVDHTVEESTIKDDISEPETTDIVCHSCGEHVVTKIKRMATPQDLTNEYECGHCGATWED